MNHDVGKDECGTERFAVKARWKSNAVKADFSPSTQRLRDSRKRGHKPSAQRVQLMKVGTMVSEQPHVDVSSGQ